MPLTPEQAIMRDASETIRRAVREAVLESTRANGPYHQQLEELEEAVITALARRDIAWALAYVAGVQMAPELLRRMAHSPPPNPTGVAGGG